MRIHHVAVVALLSLGAVHPRALAGQGSLVRPVRSDSIYRLAVDSAGYKQYPFVYLLDDGVIRVQVDGRGTETYHQIVQILKPAGIEAWAEREFSYRPQHTKLTVNWMRVVKPSGEVISDKPNIAQESNVPAEMSDPIYSDTKILRYSLSGVTVGTLVDISWTTETIDPFLRGDFQHSWSTTMAYPALRSRYALDAPASVTPRIVERHLDFKRLEADSGGRKFYAWEKTNSTPVKGEMFAPDSSVPAMSITISSPIRWADIAKWYTGLAKDRYVLSPRSLAKVDSIARMQRTAGDTLKAIHKWIARDIRYVSVALGLGGYQPRWPDSTIISGFGDCKDKATRFIAAAKHLGITAYPVLLNSNGSRTHDLPSLTQFDHVIAAMPGRGGAAYTFIDLTTDDIPAGKIPPSYQGGFGLVARADGTADEITFPEESKGVMSTTFVGTVDVSGKESGTLTILATGGAETGLREGFLEPLDSARQANMEKFMGRTFPNGKADSVVVFDGRNPKVEARVTAHIYDGEAFKRVGSVGIMAVPGQLRGNGATMVYLMSQLSSAERKLPIDAERILGTGRVVTELQLTLPEGWKAQLPAAVDAVSDFGEYHAKYTQEGRVLRISHSLAGAKGVMPKERFADLRAWMKAIADDNVDSIVLMAPPVP
jgi:transglutaminase-like putative cysteine protease